MQIKDKKILSHTEIIRKLERIAFQIYEQNFEMDEIIFTGINGMGYHMSKYLFKEFKKICDIPVTLIKITLNKDDLSQTEINFDNADIILENKTVVIIDDVLNTGTTLAFSLKPFLSVSLKKLQIAVLVDRDHKLYPVAADYIGYKLSTTINQHIKVILNQPEFAVYLL